MSLTSVFNPATATLEPLKGYAMSDHSTSPRPDNIRPGSFLEHFDKLAVENSVVKRKPAKSKPAIEGIPCTAYAGMDRIQCTNDAEYMSDDSPGAHCSWHKHLLKGHTEKI